MTQTPHAARSLRAVHWSIRAVRPDGKDWLVEGIEQGSVGQVAEEIPRQWMPAAPKLGDGYVFEYTQLAAYGSPVIVGVTTPDGRRFGLAKEVIAERQLMGRIEEALSDMSTIGWFASYLTGAAQDAWHLVVSGPREAASAASNGTGEQMCNAMRVLLTEAARQGWWPEDPANDNLYVSNGADYIGYMKTPLAQQHARSPVPALRDEATAEEVYRKLAELWSLE